MTPHAPPPGPGQVQVKLYDTNDNLVGLVNKRKPEPGDVLIWCGRTFKAGGAEQSFYGPLEYYEVSNG